MTVKKNSEKKIDRRIFKATNILRAGLASIRIELSSLDDYIDDTAETLKNKQKSLEKKYNKTKRENPEADAEINEFYSDEFYRYHELFPTFTYNSILVSQFSFFESRLKFLCELYHKKRFSNVKVTDLTGSDIEKCKRYLILVAELNFDNFNESWKKITDIQKLRNAIIHNSSIIPDEKSNENIIKFIKSDNRIEYIEPGNFYINDVSFLKEFSNHLLLFFTSLVDKLAIHKVVARNSTMPYDNTAWGQEKTENLLKEIIYGLKLIETNRTRTDEFKDSDFKNNIEGVLGTMAYDLTKLYAFFCDGEWQPEDRNLLMEKGEDGLAHLKKAYRRN